MASNTLLSPGVDVTIIDESFYGGAGPGTVPLIVLATAANKPAPASAGVSIAPYTVPSQAGQLFLATSQRELIQNFGTPTFQVVQGTPIQGDELNEYGLLAAYQFLGISNQCYVLRASIDLNQLMSSTSAPVGPPVNGTYWLNLSQTSFGVFQSNGNPVSGVAWTSQPCLYATAANVVTINGSDNPAPSFGTDGQFAIVVTQSDNLLYEKISGTWYQVGTPNWKAQRPTTVVGVTNPNNILTTDTIVINNVTVAFDQIPNGSGGYNAGTGSLSETITAINGANIPNIVASVSSSGALVIQDTIGASILLNNGNGTPLTTYGIASGLVSGVSFQETNTPQYPAGTSAGSVWIKGTTPNNGANWVLQVYSSTSASWLTVATPFYPYNSTLNDGIPSKDQAASLALGTPAAGTVYVGYDVTNGTQQLRRFNGTIWQNLIYEAGTVAPVTSPAAGTYWYNANFSADIMYGDGNEWLGYRNKYPATDPNGVIISGTAPISQSLGGPLVDNDLWIDSSDTESYPMIYRYTAATSSWGLIDNTDGTSPFGIVFFDARQDSGVAFTGQSSTPYTYQSTATSDLALSNYVDPDAPDPSAYPDGMLLFNTRFSTNNVKVWNPTYFNKGGFDPNTDYTLTTYVNGNNNEVFPPLASAGRWVTASGNDTTGAPYMGRKAQRIIVVKSLQAEITSNQDIRSELVYFNLTAVPGYPELIPDMITLNTDMKQVSFNVGDTPIRLDPSATSVSQWANNGLDVASTGEDGLTVSDDYTGVYYPWGLSTDLSGNEVMIPPSAIALCTIAYNDQVAYPWYAPAGFNRGLVTNASSVGYLNASGQYTPVILNQGQRDTLYTNKINPIAYIPGRGLVVYGQKTLEPTGLSALDRINVARLVNYLSYNLDNIVKPFLFEQNDAQTQASVTSTVNSFLNGLVGLQGLSDYAVVCDSTNNTAETIDANQLWIDIAVIPMYSIEFIYIPVRILSSGSDLTTALSSAISPPVTS
jgi:hypothetical protein